MARRVLVVGGGGAFGQHLVRGIAATTGLGIVIAGRSIARAEAAAAPMQAHFPASHIEAAALDRKTITADALRAFGAFAIVDAAGPFQHQDYRLAEAAIAAGMHYVDLADARDFVAGFARLDAAARAAGVTAVTGASSTPALSHAVLDRMTAGWSRIDTIEIAIAPGNHAPRGLSVVRSILAYAGRPVRVFLDGAWRQRPGWGLLIRKQMPGLGPRFLSLCETPDLDLVPERFEVRRTAVFRAGLELPLLHLGLSAASLPVLVGLIPSLKPFAPFFRAIADRLGSFGTDRGGMLVEAAGRDAGGHPVEAHWSLVAEAGDGPVIPTLPALVILRMLDEGQLQPGAYPCVGLVELDRLGAEFGRYRIRTDIHVERMRRVSLFASALGEGFHQMPRCIRDIHSPGEFLLLQGEASVEGSQNALGRALAALFRFPSSGDKVPVRVTMAAGKDCETWTRQFGSRCFRSVLSRKAGGGLTERFGPFSFDLDVPTSERGLSMRIAGWRLGPLRLPRFLAPTTEAAEHVDAEGRFRFDVTIAAPLAGRLVRYRGWLVPAAD